MAYRWLGVTALGLLLACAGGTETSPTGPGTGGAPGEGGASTVATGGNDVGPQLIPQSCPAGTYAVSIDEAGMLGCAALDVDIPSAVEEQCSLYLGWRDNCNGCTNGPSKYGRASGVACENLAGADNTCTTPTLGASPVQMFGLNTDNDVDGNDMFFLSWYCQRTGETPLSGPCEPGEHAVRVTADGLVECMPSRLLVAEYVRDHCTVYFGWRDGCNGCTEPPSKWGSQRDVTCEIGVGADSVCTVPLVDGQWVPQMGINTDGDVDDNDTFFVGVSCEEPPATAAPAAERCPFGTLLSGINEDGTLQCSSAAVDIAPTVRADCSLYFGYRDSCSACTDDPEKWGSTSTLACDPAFNSSCNIHDLGGVQVPLVGVRADGDVDGNDKFYAGFSCQP